MAELPDFHLGPLLRRLVDEGVEFVVVGGIAAIAHGSPRITFDLDIVYATDETNLRRLRDALVGLKATLFGVAEELPFVPDARTLSQVPLLCLETEEGRLDVMVQPDGSRGYAQLRANAMEAVMHGMVIQVAALDDLIAMKKAAGRPKDRLHLEELLAIKRLSAERNREGRAG